MEENKIIDVDYTSAELKEKTEEELTKETNQLWAQMNAIGTLGMMMAAQAGERLKEIKSRIPHGHWEDWMQHNLDFSPRKAKNMMKLADKSNDINSIFSNRQTFADIGISKIWSLLSAPEDVAEKVIKEESVEDLTVRELKEKLKASEEEKNHFKYEWEKSKDLQREIEELKKAQENQSRNPEEFKKVQEELKNRENQLSELKQEMKNLIKIETEKTKEKLLKKQDKEIKSKVEEERLKLEEEINNKNKAIEEKVVKEKEELTSKLDKAYKEIKNLEKQSNPTISEFKARTDVLQESFNGCLNVVDKSDNPGQLKAALKKLVSIMDKQLD